MHERPSRTRGTLIAASALTAAVCLLPAAPALASSFGPASTAAETSPMVLPSDAEAAETALAATPWVTTKAVDQDGEPVELADPRAANYVGNAYFDADGTFAMFNLDDTPKMSGVWDMRLDDDGDVARWIKTSSFERTVKIIDLDDAFFTYRVPGATPGEWVDIIHEPTERIEPGTEQAVIDAATAALSETPWVTTGALDENGDEVGIGDPRAANYVGNAYFDADGTFAMFNLGTDGPKMHGTWDMRVIDGRLYRHIEGFAANGNPVNRDVEIIRLDAGFFTYRVIDGDVVTDIVHEPTEYSVSDTAAAKLAATPWVTTGARDENGEALALDDHRASNYVGNAYFKADGTFTMFNLDDTPKMSGVWEMRIDEDGDVVRWIKTAAFERTVKIVQLDAEFFTYRATSEDGSYVDVVHEPTEHAEPGTAEPGTDEGGRQEEDATEDEIAEGTSSAGGTDSASTDAGGAKAVDDGAQQDDALAVTGGDAGFAAGVSLLAVASGAALLLTRLFRRRA